MLNVFQKYFRKHLEGCPVLTESVDHQYLDAYTSNLNSTMKSAEIILVLLSIGFLFACNNDTAKVPDSPYPISNDAFSIDTIAQGFTIPYGIAIIQENEYFITDRIGKMFHIKEGVQTEVTGMPEVLTFGVKIEPAIIHGGLMDINIHPNYSTHPWIYISYLGVIASQKCPDFI